MDFPQGLSGLSGTRAQVDAAASRVPGLRSAQAAGCRARRQTSTTSITRRCFTWWTANWRTVSAMQTMHRADPMDPQSPLVPAAPEDIAACIAAGLERARPDYVKRAPWRLRGT